MAATSLTGLASEDALNASFQAGGISLRGLLLAGIILGGLGVLDDVTMSQASLVFELRRADPAASFGKLVAGALAVGRDHIAATVNTLFLAYAGDHCPCWCSSRRAATRLAPWPPPRRPPWRSSVPSAGRSG